MSHEITRLCAMRKERKITQVALAKAVGVSQCTLSRYESGEIDIRKASASIVSGLARELGCTVDEVLESGKAV